MALNLPERLCECGCLRLFKPKREGQRFYSPACRSRWHMKHQQCPHCGRWIDEPVHGCRGCRFLKSLASKRGRKFPDGTGRCKRPEGFCDLLERKGVRFVGQ